MATAAVAESMHLFFCHACRSNMYPKMPDYLCSNCDSGAIEQLEEERNPQRNENRRNNTNNDPFRRFELFNRRNPSQQRSGPRFTFHIGSIDGNHVMHLDSSGNSPHVGLERFLEQLSSNLGLPVMGGPNMDWFGDYAWGINGLDNIVTQLLNQVENAGPAPADEQRIRDIPTVPITQKDIDQNLECPVCKDEFQIGAVVKKLPCSHIFHSECVDTWLKKHDSCPVCRRSLSGEEPAS